MAEVGSAAVPAGRVALAGLLRTSTGEPQFAQMNAGIARGDGHGNLTTEVMKHRHGQRVEHRGNRAMLFACWPREVEHRLDRAALASVGGAGVRAFEGPAGGLGRLVIVQILRFLWNLAKNLMEARAG